MRRRECPPRIRASTHGTAFLQSSASDAVRRPDRIRPMLRTWLASFLLLATAAPAVADPRLPAIFSDHMVLQQQMPLGVWGWAAPDERIEVRLRAQRVATTADRHGRWQVT